MGELSYTVGGDSNLVSFKSAARVPITSLKAHFKPKQDLHGYSKPWPAGGGKNLFNKNDSSIIYQLWPGLDKMNLVDHPIYSVIIPCKPNTTYTMSKSVQTVIFVGCYLTEAPANNVVVYGRSFTDNYTATVTTGEDAEYLVCWFYNNLNGDETSTVAEVLDTLQIEVGSTATSYVPYENICPIEGWNGCEGNISGINLIPANATWHSFRGRPQNDKLIGSVYHIIVVPVPKGTIYIHNGHKNNGYINYVCLADILPAENITVYKADSKSNYTNYTIDNTDGHKYLFISGPTIDNPTDVYTWCVSNETSISTAAWNDIYYKPSGTTIPITFPVLGKNKFNWNVEQSHSTPVSSDPQNARTFIPNTYVIGMSVNNYYRDNYTNWVLNPSVENGVIHIESGAASGYGIAFPLELVPGQTYFLSGTRPIGEGSLGVSYYDKDGKQISYNNDRLGKTITIPENAVITLIGFYATSPNSTFEFSNIQLELGTAATVYEPYDPNNTIYGGYVDIAAGEIVITHQKLTADGSISWTFGAYPVNNNNRVLKPITALGGDSPNISQIQRCPFNYLATDANSNGIWTGYIATTGNVVLRVPEYINSAATWSSYLAEHPLEFTYELATPIHYPLSKSQLQTLLNQNNIWSNANDVTEVSYAIHDAAPIRAAKHRIAANEPHIETIENKLVNFNTDMQAPLKSCKVNFEPKQDLHGYDSVWIGGNGKNLFNVNAEFANPSDTTLANTTARTFTPGTYCLGISHTNYFIPGNVTTCTVVDGALTVNTKQGYGVGFPLKLTAGNTYYMSATIGNNEVGRIGAAFYDASGNYLSGISIVSGNYGIRNSSFTIPADVDITVIIFASENADTIFTNIQLELGSTATSYAPYENICPISGWEGLEVYKAGKNLIDSTRFLPKSQLVNGVVSSANVYGIYSVPIPQNKTIYWSKSIAAASVIGLADSEASMGVPYYDVITNTNRYNWSWQSGDHSYILLQMGNADTNGGISRGEMVRLNENDATYEAPSGTTIPLDWSDSAGTIYGGYVDLVSGVLTVTNAVQIFTGEENWAADQTANFYTRTDHSGQATKIQCSHFPSNTMTTTGTVPNCYISGTGYLNLQTTAIEHNNSAMKAYCAEQYANNTPLTIVYPITPITYQLSPQLLKTLRGINNIWSNSNGNISVSYYTH